MRVDIKQFLADAVARCLNRCMLLLLPANRRAWGHALVAEQQEISHRQERLAWAAGGIAICLNELIQRICSDGPTWTAGIAFGIVSALVDLHSTTRLAVHTVVVVRVGSCVLVGKVGMAMDSFACIEFAPRRTGHEPLAPLLDRPLRRILWTCSGDVRHMDWARAAPAVNSPHAQARRPLRKSGRSSLQTPGELDWRVRRQNDRMRKITPAVKPLQQLPQNSVARIGGSRPQWKLVFYPPALPAFPSKYSLPGEISPESRCAMRPPAPTPGRRQTAFPLFPRAEASHASLRLRPAYV